MISRHGGKTGCGASPAPFIGAWCTRFAKKSRLSRNRFGRWCPARRRFQEGERDAADLWGPRVSQPGREMCGPSAERKGALRPKLGFGEVGTRGFLGRAQRATRQAGESGRGPRGRLGWPSRGVSPFFFFFYFHFPKHFPKQNFEQKQKIKTEAHNTK